MSEDFRRLPKTFEEDPKMFQSYTNDLKNNIRDKLSRSEIINILTSVLHTATAQNERQSKLGIYRLC